jgi:hypothetical protein
LREIGNRPAIVFLTVCTKSKKQILANEAVHDTLREAWKAADSWLVGRYPKSGSWRFGIGVEVACGMVDGIKSLV